MLNRRRLVFAGTLVAAWAALAQQTKLFRIGVLETTPIEGNANFETFRRTLTELGYQNLAFEYRSSYGGNERFKDLAVQLVRLKVDLILTRGTPASLAAKAATRTIPIVTTAASDPVRTGLVASVARPGGNVTGFDPFAGALMTKRLELIKETLPAARKIGALLDMSNPINQLNEKDAEATARSRGIEYRRFNVTKADDIAPAFQTAEKQKISALTVGIDGVMSANLEMIVQLAAKHRVPVIYASREFVDAGGLMSYAVDYRHLYVRAANYVDRILKGANAGDLPVEQPTRFEVAVNLKAAKALGLTIPQSVLLRADWVIE
jgi:putative ABC transport system substrate-binding protein